jgi:hypothetical protein
MILHPILLAVCPVLSMYFANRWIVPVADLWITIGLMLLVAAILWSILFIITRDIEKAGLLVSVFLLLMFAFQNLLFGTNSLFVLLGLTDAMLSWITSDANLIFWILVELLLFLLICRQVLSGKWNTVFLTGFMNYFSIALFFIALLSWLPTETSRAVRQNSLIDPFESEWKSMVQTESCVLQKQTGPLPDIYIIVMDGYLRDDVLRQIYNVDNTPFLSELEKRGFYIARNSRSNGRHTAVTLSTMLNYDYLESFNKTNRLDTLSESHLGTIIQNNRTFHQLRCLGYEITSLDTGFFYSDFPNSDQVISTGLYPNNFTYQIASVTPFTLVTLPADYDTQRKRMLSTLENIQKIPRSGQPKFVYTHIMVGHPPFIFGREGQPINPPREMRFDTKHYFQELIPKETFIQGYKDQVTYITEKIPEMIDGILANSQQSPIIILMGDHGPGFYFADKWERMSILNAYHFPDGITSQLYPGITPVNSLRVVFNTYFQAALPLLPDISNYAPPDNLSNFEDVTEQIPDNPAVSKYR